MSTDDSTGAGRDQSVAGKRTEAELRSRSTAMQLLGLAVGLSFGVALGVFTGSFRLGIGIGLAVGLSLGALWGWLIKRQ